MKINIQKREPDKNGLRPIRLVYYYGSKTSEDGSRAQKRSYEPLNLFLYNKPKNAVEREYNKTTLQKAEAIRAKRLLEMESAKHGLDDRTKLNASFFDYFDQVTASKASGSKSNYSIWVSAGIYGPIQFARHSIAILRRVHCTHIFGLLLRDSSGPDGYLLLLSLSSLRLHYEPMPD